MEEILKSFKSVIHQSQNQELLMSMDEDGNAPRYQLSIEYNEDESASFKIFFVNSKASYTRLILKTLEIIPPSEEEQIKSAVLKELEFLGCKIK